MWMLGGVGAFSLCITGRKIEHNYSAFKKNLTASATRSEHPPCRREKIKLSKKLDGDIGCKDKSSPWDCIGFLDGGCIGSTVSRNIGIKLTVILYTYIDHHEGAPKQKQNKAHGKPNTYLV